MKNFEEKSFIFIVLAISFTSCQVFDYDGEVATRDNSFDYPADGRNWRFQSNPNDVTGIDWNDEEISMRAEDIDDLFGENNLDFTEDNRNNNSSNNNNDNSDNNNVVDDTENTTGGAEILDKIAGGSKTDSSSGTVSFPKLFLTSCLSSSIFQVITLF